jgi:hypothetical protein
VEGQRGEEERGAVPLGRARMPALAEARVHVRDDGVESGEEDRPEREPGHDLRERALLERRDQEAEGRRREHHSRREAEQDAQDEVGRTREHEQEEAADRRAGPGGEDGCDRDGVHGPRP